MEQNETSTLLEVRRQRLRLRGYLILYSSAVVVGMCTTRILYIFTPARAGKIYGAIIAGIAIAQVVAGFLDMLELRRWKKELTIERDGILTMIRADLEAKHCSPEEVEAVMNRLKEQVPEP